MKEYIKQILLICHFWIGCISTTFAQLNLSGTVYDGLTNSPLPFASVYFNSTTNGTITDENGKFTITVNPNHLELIVSFIGYDPLSHNLDTNQISRPHSFYLQPAPEIIETVQINAKRDQTWYYNLALFKDQFLGTSSFAKKTRILNEEAIYFSFDASSRLLQAFSREALEIINEDLGYRITYNLKEFYLDMKRGLTVFLGYPRYEELENKPKKKWLKNREKAYKGSIVHFTHALTNNTLEKEGFRVYNMYKSKENFTGRDKETIEINLGKDKPSGPKSGSIGKGVTYLDTNPINAFDSLTFDQGSISLQLKNHWQVVYNKEKEDKYYTPPGKLYDPKRKRGPQTSSLSLPTEYAKFNQAGFLINPLEFLVEGYWSHEKLADMVPLDYVPQDD